VLPKETENAVLGVETLPSTSTRDNPVLPMGMIGFGLMAIGLLVLRQRSAKRS
jgi:LPXTG-motif cell wall-anchored protein